MMKYFVFLCCGIILSGCFKKVPKPIIISQNFEIGKKYSFEIVRSKVDLRTRRGEGLRSITSATLNIEPFGDNARLCRLLFGKTNYEGLNALLFDKNSDETLDYLHDVKLTFITDTIGSIKELINVDSSIIQLKKNLRFAYGQIPGTTSESVDYVMQIMTSTFEDDELFLGAYFPEIAAFFQIFNDTLLMDSVYRSTSTSFNPLNQRPITFNEVKGLERIDNGIATILVIQSLPEAEATHSNFTIDNLPISDGDNIAIIKIDNKVEYTYDINQGKLKSVSSQKLIQVDSAFQEQRFRILQME